MTEAFRKVQDLMGEMTPSEKAELLRWVIHDLRGEVPGIESAPGVSGGDARIVRTRIPVWVLEQARRLGTSDAELLRAYPALRAADLASAWAYVAAHPDEVDRQIHENEAA